MLALNHHFRLIPTAGGPWIGPATEAARRTATERVSDPPEVGLGLDYTARPGRDTRW